jgi:tetratricopeptide (TPR) repeat protein
MGEYASAINRWEKLLEQRPNNDTLNYFLGASSLAAGQDEKAVNYLQKALESKETAFAEEAWWYLGLTWLKQGEIEKAKQALQKSNKPEAKKLMEDLVGK